MLTQLHDAMVVSGFASQQLNGLYILGKSLQAGGVDTWWKDSTKKELYFMYWQLTEKRWAICHRNGGCNGELNSGLLLVQKGFLRGNAYKCHQGDVMSKD
jgi:hypothetical protein